MLPTFLGSERELREKERECLTRVQVGKSGVNYSYLFQVVVAGHQFIHLYLIERNVHF
jgi:hypothetical protein